MVIVGVMEGDNDWKCIKWSYSGFFKCTFKMYLNFQKTKKINKI